MTHQTADAAVAVGERVHVVEAVMGDRHRDHPAPAAHAGEPEPILEISHERRDRRARRRLVTSDDDVLIRRLAPPSRLHAVEAVPARDGEHRVRRAVVEREVEPAHELARRRFRQDARAGEAIDFRLDANVRRGLVLEIAARLVRIEIAVERTFDVARTRVVALDEVAIVRVHDPHEARETRGGPRVQGDGEFGRLGREIGDDLRHERRHRIECGRFDARRAFDHGIWPIFRRSQR